MVLFLKIDNVYNSLISGSLMKRALGEVEVGIRITHCGEGKVNSVIITDYKVKNSIYGICRN